MDKGISLLHVFVTVALGDGALLRYKYSISWMSSKHTIPQWCIHVRGIPRGIREYMVHFEGLIPVDTIRRHISP